MGKRSKKMKLTKVDLKEFMSQLDGKWVNAGWDNYTGDIEGDKLFLVGISKKDRAEIVEIYKGPFENDYYIFTKDGRAGNLEKIPFYIISMYSFRLSWMDEVEANLIKKAIEK